MNFAPVLLDEKLRDQTFAFLRDGGAFPSGGPFADGGPLGNDGPFGNDEPFVNVGTFGNDGPFADDEQSSELFDTLTALGQRDLLQRLLEVLNVIELVGRPMIPVRGGSFTPPTLPALGHLAAARPALETAARAVGRLEVDGLTGFAGTGWLVDWPGHTGIVVTNRHVVTDRFGTGSGNAAEFLAVGNDYLSVSLVLDGFLAGEKPSRIKVKAIRRLDEQADLAVLQLADDVALPAPIAVGMPPVEGTHLALIGYPDDDPADKADNTLLAKKDMGRQTLSPGVVKVAAGDQFEHDASTTGGSSGSPVLDLDGVAVGVHFRGTPRTPGARRLNAAVSATALRTCLTAALGA